MRCHNCGNEQPDTFGVFCAQCGTRQTPQQQQPTPQPAQQQQPAPQQPAAQPTPQQQQQLQHKQLVTVVTQDGVPPKKGRSFIGKVAQPIADLCPKCNKAITVDYTSAMDKKWHPECFACKGCNQPLEGNFCEHDNDFYCENCMNKVLPCAKCGGGIVDTYTTDGRNYHPECFAPNVCAGCHKDILSAELAALGKQWHPECLVCSNCRKQVLDKILVRDDQPLCEPCAIATRVVVNCSKCLQPISGETITYGEDRMHSHCFKCYMCSSPLDPALFYDVKGQFACGTCVNK